VEARKVLTVLDDWPPVKAIKRMLCITLENSRPTRHKVDALGTSELDL
jgi:hypothetical protein